MTVPLDTITALLGAWLWPFFRCAALLTAAPLFGAAYVPTRVRLALALTLALVLAPVVPAPAVDPFSLAGLLLVLQQVLVGLLLGIAVRLVLVVFDLAGQVISQTMGLGFAAMVDPSTGAQVPAVSQLYLLLASLVFVTLNGHLLMVQVLAHSFEVVPVGGAGIEIESFWQLASRAGWVFGAGVLLALPAVTAMLVVNLAFGVMTRAAPQLNLFAVGFPLTLLMGFVVILLTLPGVLSEVDTVVGEALGFASALLVGGP